MLPSPAKGGCDIKQCHQVKELGKGSFGSVTLSLRPDGRFMAVKRVQVEKNEEAASAVKDFVKEVGVMNQCNHKNIVGYLGSHYEETEREFILMIFQEYVTGGSASALCKALSLSRKENPPPGFNEDINGIPIAPLKVFSRHIVEGLAYLHSKNIAHRDIKGDNVLISHDTGVAKLADFGAAHLMQQTMQTKGRSAQTFTGTPYWMAPEVIASESGYDATKADIWSLGCTIAEMWTGKLPWKPQKQLMTVIYAIAQSKGWPDGVPKKDCPAELRDLLEKCFQRDPTKRPTAAQLLHEPFLSISHTMDRR